MVDLHFKYKELIQILEKESLFIPDISIVLGSGLGDFAESVDTIKTISTSDLPNYPKSTIPGHQGKIHFAKYSGKNILLFQGRIHFYEGYSLNQCILPVLIAHQLGSKKILLTNAAGGINVNFKPGDLMLNDSFNSINIKKELTDLIGLGSLDTRNRFIDFPSSLMNEKFRKAALEEDITLQSGVYWFTKGPSYETPAEIKMMAKFGADAVGMSTVHEAVYAAHLGMDVGAISCITNFAAGISPVKLSHNDVTETANLVKATFERLVKRIISIV
ncbi:MAG: purine-nucleoside phosphorylase [Ignavibacteriales bacterium]|nr:purine-nucleoside phosphorylase [Ignavibacteriales bacterium]